MLILPNLIDPKCDTDFLQEVDKVIKKKATTQYDNIRYGFNKKVNFTSLNTLIMLRDIYISKLNCADWLCNFTMEQVIASLRKELRSTC